MDQQVVLFVLVATFGGIIASYTYSHFLDQLGSRPLMVITGFLDIAGVTLVIFLPKQFSALLIGILFFINGYVHIALFAAMQHYFISISNRAHQLAQGIITRGLGGIAGGLALGTAGWILGKVKLMAIGVNDPLTHFRWFYAGMLVLLIVRTIVFLRLPPLRSQGVRNALSALFSPWDWRAIHAVKRAISVQSEDEESKALAALMQTDTQIYQGDLERYLNSPSIFIRQRAMDALQRTKPTKSLISILEKDLEVNQFTTAHRAAYWLGHWKVMEAAPSICNAIESEDFLLSGAAIHALVELDEQRALPIIEKQFSKSDNPYVLIEGARALSIWGNFRYYRMLLQKYLLRIPPQAKDELSLSVARLLGLYDSFYSDLGMLRRERMQLFHEWQERYGTLHEEELVNSIRREDYRRGYLEETLERQKNRFRSWFFEDTSNFLKRLPERVRQQTAFLVAFLLLSEVGLHIESS
jgi:HEAT repeat protein